MDKIAELIVIGLLMVGGGIFVWLGYVGILRRRWVWSGVLVLLGAGLVGIMTWRSAAASGPPPALTAGLPWAANVQAMAVYLPSGHPVILDAAAYTTIVVGAQQGPAWSALQQAYNALPGVKRPLVLVVTGFTTSQVVQALHHVSVRMRQQHITLPWVAQMGPTTLYTRQWPVLLTVSTTGHTRPIYGLTAIEQQMRQHSVLPHAVVSHPRQTSAVPAQAPTALRSTTSATPASSH